MVECVCYSSNRPGVLGFHADVEGVTQRSQPSVSVSSSLHCTFFSGREHIQISTVCLEMPPITSLTINKSVNHVFYLLVVCEMSTFF